MSTELPNLPYPYDALEPVISAQTLKLHHRTHHRAYVEKLNALVAGTDLADDTLEAIVQKTAHCGAADRTLMTIFSNAGQAWNHAFYWNSLRPMSGQGPQRLLAQRIDYDFGGQRDFDEALKAAATGYFGSGWAWLVVDDGALRILTTANADTPIVHGLAPLLVIDVWEHAYYLDHRANRAKYVEGVVHRLLNWNFAEENYRSAMSGSSRRAVPAASCCA